MREREKVRGSGNKHSREIVAETQEMLLLYMIVEKEAKGCSGSTQGGWGHASTVITACPVRDTRAACSSYGVRTCICPSYLALGVIACINRK